MGSVVDTNGIDAKDKWEMAQGGFRFDYSASEKDKLSLQGNVYYGKPNPDGDSNAVIASGDNVLARWNHKISEKADFQLQVYYDHTWRDFRNKFTEDLKTYDIDWQNRYQIGKRHIVTYGLGVRKMDHRVNNLELFGFFPGHKSLYIFNIFAQYEAMLIEEHLRFTLGTKLEHNSYTNFQHQPNARLTWTPQKQQTIWAAASRAVRNPSRIDREFKASLTPTFPVFLGSAGFLSETMTAYELGWRFQPVQKLSLSVSTFYNVYDNIRSAEPGPPPFGFPIIFANGVKGKTYGAELSFNSQLTNWWSIRGGYTFLKKELVVKPNSKDANKGSAESNDPQHQFLFQSNIKLPYGLQLGTVARYVDQLPKPEVPHYIGLDVRLEWKVNKILDLSVVAQNLVYKTHTEYIASTPPRELQRSIYGRITCRF
jgi:iron complex outermembrane receptor protein